MPIAGPKNSAELAGIEDLRRQRERTQFALGSLRAELAAKHGPIGGKVAALSEIQSALPDDTALVAWVDRLPAGPKAADPGGEHWGVVVRCAANPCGFACTERRVTTPGSTTIRDWSVRSVT